jgi:hypothetical protein
MIENGMARDLLILSPWHDAELTLRATQPANLPMIAKE